ncbi:MerR family transcriptional regulator [Bacillus sp. V3B]|uniref:MerR family transcriptional regulator n=1 Tax=Bacillus sp. V3B TaxID=2804915 RepID=UPI002108BA56|nr:MerR family transcriptional regulator [Bacillus sp. V3B]MCQ6275427.1 MerR family transcriptional regulator [Bacillus sp. V3B]
MTKYLTIAEIAEQADIPNSSCRRYLASFESFFVVKGGSRLKKYEQQAVDVLKRIKDLYDNGMDTHEIHSVLANEFPLVISGDKQEVSNEQAGVSTLATSEDINEIKKALDEQQNFNKLLLEKLEQQNLYYEQKFEELKQDRELIGSLRDSMQQRQLESSERENKTSEQFENINQHLVEIQQTIKETAVSEQKKGFFQRLFNK